MKCKLRFAWTFVAFLRLFTFVEECVNANTLDTLHNATRYLSNRLDHFEVLRRK